MAATMERVLLGALLVKGVIGYASCYAEYVALEATGVESGRVGSVRAAIEYH